MNSDAEKETEWVPYADGNADAMFAFDVEQANKDPYNEMARKFNGLIPNLGVQCLKCGRVHSFANLLKGCPVCSRVTYAFRGSTSQLNLLCTECGATVLSSVRCQCGSVNPINGRTMRKPKTGGCFIATATYGSSFAPEVTVFRQFRDNVLLSSRLGASFVRFYYFLSPPAAAIVANNWLIRTLIRRLLLAPMLRLIKH